MTKRSRRDELGEVNLLELTPVRIAKWEEVGERVVVLRPAPTSRGLKRLLDSFLHALSARRLRLDDIGSFAWRELDGERTVGQVASRMRERFGDSVEPATERLGHLIRAMHREGLVAYRGWDADASV
jgi:hypothetical protein